MTTPLPSAVTIAPEVAEASEMLKPVTHGLVSFQLKPEGLRGLELFEHMVQFKKRHAAGVGFFEAESRLDLAISDVQKTIFEPTPYDLTCRELMKDAGGAGATLKLAKRKLDALGSIKAYCGEANSDERIKKLERAAKLADSLAQISRLGTEIKTQEMCDATLELYRVTPEALRKLQLKDKDVSKLKIKEIGALLVRYFALAVPKGANEVHVKALQDAIEANPGRLVDAFGAVDELRVDETHKVGEFIKDAGPDARAAYGCGFEADGVGVDAGDVISDGGRDADSTLSEDAGLDARSRGGGLEADDEPAAGDFGAGKQGGVGVDAGDVFSDGGRDVYGKLSADAGRDARAPRGRGQGARVPRGGGVGTRAPRVGGLGACDDLDESGDDEDETTLLLEGEIF